MRAHPMSAALPLALAAAGLVNVVVGCLIRYRRMYDLIAGFDARRSANPERVAAWVGGCAIVMGAECLASSIALVVWPDVRLTLRLFPAAVIVTVLAMFAPSKRR